MAVTRIPIPSALPVEGEEMRADRIVPAPPPPTLPLRDPGTHHRQTLLETINGIIVPLGSRPWTMASLGDRSKGEVEIAALEDVIEVNDRRVRLMLRLRMPGGDTEVVPLHFGGTLVFVVPNLCLPGETKGDHYHIFMMKRWRPELQGFSYELPKAVVYGDAPLVGNDRTHASDPFNTGAFAIIERIFGSDCGTSVGATSVHRLGGLVVKGESERAEVQLLTAMLRFSFKRRVGEGEIVRLKWQQIASLLRNSNMITDAETIACLHKASRWLGEV